MVARQRYALMAKNKKRKRKLSKKQDAGMRDMLSLLSAEVSRLRNSIDRLATDKNSFSVAENEESHKHAYAVADSLKN